MGLWRLAKRPRPSKGLSLLESSPRTLQVAGDPDWLEGKITLETDGGQGCGETQKSVTRGVGG